MAEQKNANQVFRELKWLNVKEPDPSSLNLRELRGRMSMRNYTHPPLDSYPRPNTCAQYSSKFRKKCICLPLPINQSTLALVSTISLQLSSDLGTDEDEITDETIKQVVQTVAQTLLKTTRGSPTSNLNVSNTSHNYTSDRQSVPTLNTSDNHEHTTTSPKHTKRPDSSENTLTHPITHFQQTKQIIMDIDALSCSPTLHNKILQELNLNGF